MCFSVIQIIPRAVEPSETKCLHRNSGSNRGDGQRFLAHDLAREGQRHHYADENI